VVADWDVLPAVTDMQDSLDGKIVIHPDLGDNKCFNRELVTEGFEDAFSKADVVVEKVYEFSRHTGVTNEPRGVLADYRPRRQHADCVPGTRKRPT
jgi:carbon-monoxide dehydrogenase large subunit